MLAQLKKWLPIQSPRHEPVWWLFVAAELVNALAQAVTDAQVNGEDVWQAVVGAVFVLVARSRVTPTAKLPSRP